MNDVIAYMKSHPLWDDYEKFLIEQRPLIPTFDPNEDNTSIWKHASAKREGFDLLLKHLRIEVDENE